MLGSMIADNGAIDIAVIARLVNGAPAALDTLEELADALGDDANYAATITTALAAKAPLVSPALTGNPTVPTQAASNNSTRAASTAYVDTADALKANLVSPTFTGTPAAPTPAVGDNTTKLATTAYVDRVADVVGGLIVSGLDSSDSPTGIQAAGYTPTAWATKYAHRFGGAAACWIPGLLALPAGTRRLIRYVGSATFTLWDQDPLETTAANRLALPQSLPIVLQPGEAVEIVYESTLWSAPNYVRPPSDLWLPTQQLWAPITGYGVDALYRGDDGAGGGGMHDAANNRTLAEVSTGIAYQRYKNGKRGLYVSGAASGWDAAVNDFANTNTIFGGWIAVEDTSASTRTILGRSETAAGIYCVIAIKASSDGTNPNKVYITLSDNNNTYNVILNKTMTDGVPRLVLVGIDRTGTTLYARVAAPGEAAVSGSVSIAGAASLTGGTLPKFCYGLFPGIQSGATSWCGGAFVRVNAEATGANLLQQHSHRLGAE